MLLFFSRPRIPEACRSKSPSLTASCSAKRELRKCLHKLLAIALFLSFTSNKEAISTLLSLVSLHLRALRRPFLALTMGVKNSSKHQNIQRLFSVRFPFNSRTHFGALLCATSPQASSVDFFCCSPAGHHPPATGATGRSTAPRHRTLRLSSSSSS